MTLPTNQKLIDSWFPCAAVDHAVTKPAGSGKVEKAIFPWFASRPIAQARAAALCALLPDEDSLRPMVNVAVQSGERAIFEKLVKRVHEIYPAGRPVVVDFFSGRGIIPLEASRAGAAVAGVDLSPVATLAGRILGDYLVRDWSGEKSLPFSPDVGELMIEGTEPKVVADARVLHAEIGRRLIASLAPYFPRNGGDEFPWGYLWAVTILCDGCRRRFPLIGSLSLRHPYRLTKDIGQAFRIVTTGDTWFGEVFDGTPDQLPTFRAATGKKGKSAHCPFCRFAHSLDTVKAKGWAGEYEDAPLLAAETVGEAKKVFRSLRTDERTTAAAASALLGTYSFGGLSGVPDEQIPEGNEDTIRASGYGYRTFGDLMCDRQTLQFVETVRLIRACHAEMLAAGVSTQYATALTAFAAATLVRRLKYATRGARLQVFGKVDGSGQNRSAVGHVFAEESKLSFNFDFFESGLGKGPGTWTSLAQTGLQSLAKHASGVKTAPGRFVQGSAMALPVRDGTVDAVITDPPYYNMIDYADASDLFYVWLRRLLSDVVPDLFGGMALQDKSEEIIVKRGNARTEHRTREFYEKSLSKAFCEARRILRPDGHLVVVFGHSDPDAWKRLLGALHQAGFVVMSSWPSRTESANTGVASIKVTVTIGCRVAPADRPTATAAQVDREVSEAIRARVRGWEKDGLALTDQLMAAYGPAMAVYGRYSRVLLPDGGIAPLERYLTLARTAVRDAAAMKLDQIPLETFDAITRFAVFWMRLYGRTVVPKSEARFLAQADNLRLEDVRSGLLEQSKAGYKLTLRAPSAVGPTTPVIDVVRAMADAWQKGGTDAAAEIFAQAERPHDDQHLWAVVADLATQLPTSDATARALTGLQRNIASIQMVSRRVSGMRRKTDDSNLSLDL